MPRTSDGPDYTMPTCRVAISIRATDNLLFPMALSSADNSILNYL